MGAVKLVALLMLVSLTFGAGLQVDFDHLITTLKNVPLLVKALIANCVIVPILGVLLVRLFALPEDIATGFLLMAIAPGVPFVLASVRKRGGSLGLAVALAAMLPLVSIVTVPLTARYALPLLRRRRSRSASSSSRWYSSNCSRCWSASPLVPRRRASCRGSRASRKSSS